MRGAGGIGRVEGVGGVGGVEGEARKTLRNGNYFRKRNKKVTKVPRFGTRHPVISPYPLDILALRSYL